MLSSMFRPMSSIITILPLKYLFIGILLSIYYSCCNIILLVNTSIIIAFSLISLIAVIRVIYCNIYDYTNNIYTNKKKLNSIPIIESAKYPFTKFTITIVFFYILLTRNSLVYPHIVYFTFCIVNNPKLLVSAVILLWILITVFVSLGIINKHLLVSALVTRIIIVPLVVIITSLIMYIEIPFIGMNILACFSLEFLFLPLTGIGSYYVQMNTGNNGNYGSNIGGPSNTGWTGNFPGNNYPGGNGSGGNGSGGNGSGNNGSGGLDPNDWSPMNLSKFKGWYPAVDLAYVLAPGSVEYVKDVFPDPNRPIQPELLNKSCTVIIDLKQQTGERVKALRAPPKNLPDSPMGTFSIEGVWYRGTIFSRTNGIRNEDGTIEFPTMSRDPYNSDITTMGQDVKPGINGGRSIRPLNKSFDKKFSLQGGFPRND